MLRSLAPRPDPRSPRATATLGPASCPRRGSQGRPSTVRGGRERASASRARPDRPESRRGGPQPSSGALRGLVLSPATVSCCPDHKEDRPARGTARAGLGGANGGDRHGGHRMERSTSWPSGCYRLEDAAGRPAIAIGPRPPDPGVGRPSPGHGRTTVKAGRCGGDSTPRIFLHCPRRCSWWWPGLLAAAKTSRASFLF